MNSFESPGFDPGGHSHTDHSRSPIVRLANVIDRPALVLGRKHTGYQLLGLTIIAFTVLALAALNAVENTSFFADMEEAHGYISHSNALLYLAVAFGIAAGVQRRQRYLEFKSGAVTRHSYYRGTSYLAHVLEPYVRRDWVYRFIEPGALLALGWLVKYFGLFGLGVYLMVAGIALAIVQDAEHKKVEGQVWGISDKKLEAEAVSLNVAGIGLGGAVPAHGAAKVKEGASAPTGADDHLKSAIAARKRAAGLADGCDAASAEKEETKATGTSPAWSLSRMDGSSKLKLAVAGVMVVALLFVGNNLRRQSQQLAVRNAYIAAFAQSRGIPTQPPGMTVAARVARVTPPVSNVSAVPQTGAGSLAQPVTNVSVPVATAPTLVMPPPATPVSTALDSPGAPIGHFEGGWTSGKEGICTISLDVREEEPGQFLGYPIMSCFPISPLLSKESKAPADVSTFMRKLNPSSAILKGTMVNGTLVFQVSKVTSSNEEGCTFSSPYSVTPFASTQVSIDWHDACGGGSALLTKRRQ